MGLLLVVILAGAAASDRRPASRSLGTSRRWWLALDSVDVEHRRGRGPEAARNRELEWEGVLLSGTAAGPRGSVPAFAAGIGLWAAALALISAPPRFSGWLRLLGTIAAALFAITAVRIYAGESLLPTSSPLPFLAYPFLVATLLGWAWMLLREEA